MANLETCRHFNGVQNDVCSAGISYQSVRQDNEAFATRFPCLHANGASVCSHYAHYTAEEIKEYEAEVAAVIGKLTAFERGESDACLVCGEKVTQMRQVGRCVYAEPCGHRLWQGRIPKAWQDRGGVEESDDPYDFDGE